LDEHRHGGIGGSPECLLCPVCVLLQAVSTSRPEVTQHLLTAARELALALKAAAESQVEAYDRARARSEGLRRINIDDPGQG
jgi:hypothetical protein